MCFSIKFLFDHNFFNKIFVSFINSFVSCLLLFSNSSNSKEPNFSKAIIQISLFFIIFVDFFSLMIQLYIFFNFSFLKLSIFNSIWFVITLFNFSKINEINLSVSSNSFFK
ncbi:hypothetical protein HOG21_05070 [bacterium]|nr:hypothetical protein [bacterium]